MNAKNKKRIRRKGRSEKRALRSNKRCRSRQLKTTAHSHVRQPWKKESNVYFDGDHPSCVRSVSFGKEPRGNRTRCIIRQLLRVCVGNPRIFSSFSFSFSSRLDRMIDCTSAYISGAEIEHGLTYIEAARQPRNEGFRVPPIFELLIFSLHGCRMQVGQLFPPLIN
jgi:hypothetical protein